MLRSPCLLCSLRQAQATPASYLGSSVYPLGSHLQGLRLLSPQQQARGQVPPSPLPQGGGGLLHPASGPVLPQGGPGPGAAQCAPWILRLMNLPPTPEGDPSPPPRIPFLRVCSPSPGGHCPPHPRLLWIVRTRSPSSGGGPYPKHRISCTRGHGGCPGADGRLQAPSGREALAGGLRAWRATQKHSGGWAAGWVRDCGASGKGTPREPVALSLGQRSAEW